MTSTNNRANFNKKNLASDHYNLDGIYILSMVSSIILAGFAEAVNKCDKYKDNNPLCIPPDEVIYHRRLQMGGRELDAVDERLADSVNKKTQPIGTSTVGKFMDLAQAVNGKLLNVFENTSKTLLDVKNVANNPNINLDITNFLDQNKELIKQMTRDPVVQAALREWIEEMGILNIQLLDMAKPNIDLLIGKTVETFNDAAAKATRGIMSTGLNLLEAFLGEIPVAGGVMDIVIAFMRGFNSAMHASAPVVEFSTEAFFRAVKTVFTTFAIVKEKGEDIQRAAYKVKGAVDNINESMSSAAILDNFEKKGREAGEDYVSSVLDNLPKVPTVDPGKSLNSLADKELEERFAKLKEKDEDKELEEENKKDTKKKATPVSKKGGGYVKHRANIQKRIKHVTHRLKKTIRTFMRRTKKHKI